MKSIKEKLDKIKQKGLLLENNKNFFNLILIVFVAFSSFALGKLSVIEKTNQTAITLYRKDFIANISNSIDQKNIKEVGKYVASKNSDKYHAPWCSGAARIKEDNQIWFQSKEEAEKAGYSPASNCKGI